MKSMFSMVKTLGLIALLSASILMAIYILQNQQFDFQINALLSDQPTNVFVTDIKTTSVKISWQTEKEVIGGIRITNLTNKVYFEVSATKYHTLFINGLQPGINYQFIVMSDGVEFNETAETFTTSNLISTEIPRPYYVYGQVFRKDGTALQKDGLLYLTLNKFGVASQKLVAQINNAGGYQFDLQDLTNDQLNGFFNYADNVDLKLEIYYEYREPVLVKKFTLNFASTRQIPNIYLGDINLEEIPGVDGSN